MRSTVSQPGPLDPQRSLQAILAAGLMLLSSSPPADNGNL